MHVSLVDPNGEHECIYGRYGVQTGGLGFGPAVPSLRYQCGGAYVGISIMADLDYRPRRCFYAPAQGPNATVRLRFDSIAFGKVLHGHHGLYVEAERDQKGAPVDDRLSLGRQDRSASSFTATAKAGRASSSTRASSMERPAELVAEITSSSRDRRMYCFEADTR